jgi:hypothetical protein
MANLSERANNLKGLLVMMEREPQKFAQEAVCGARILEKLLPKGCEQAIAKEKFPGGRARESLRLKVLEYIVHDILIQNHEAILGSLFLWEMYLNRPGIGQYRRISMKDVADYWNNPDSLIDFMEGPVEEYLQTCGKHKLSRTIQEFNQPEKGIYLLRNLISPNGTQPSTNQVRTLNNYLNTAVDRLALEVERASLERVEVSPAETHQIDRPETAPTTPDILVPVRELMSRECKGLLPSHGIQITDETVILRTILTDSGDTRPNWNETSILFHNASGVLVSPPHTGKTTYVKMLALKNAETETDCVIVYISAVDLKAYALMKRSVCEYLADQLIREGLRGIESYETDVRALQQAVRIGKIIFFVDELEPLNLDEERAIILQFALYKQVFFVVTPWAAERIKRLMAEYNPNRPIKTFFLSKLTFAEREELVSRLEQQFTGFQIAATQFLSHTYSNLFDQPIGLVALAAEYQRSCGYLGELFIAQRIMNTLLMQAGLNSYEINFDGLINKSYRFELLGAVLAYRKPASFKNYIVRIGDDPELFWPVSILDQVFGTDNRARNTFVHTFLEPDPNDPNRVRFFLKDFHYLLLAIHYVLPDIRIGKFSGSLIAESYYCTSPEKRSPDLDPTSIVRLYQLDLLSYLARPEIEAWIEGQHQMGDRDRQ